MTTAPVYRVITSDGCSDGYPAIDWDRIYDSMVVRNSPDDFGDDWRPAPENPDHFTAIIKDDHIDHQPTDMYCPRTADDC